MNNRIVKLVLKHFSVFLSLVILFVSCPLTVSNAADSSDPIIVVSLGDSYSSGEGVEPFYGQEKSIPEKIKDKNWLAHRSRKAWPALLKVGNKITGNYNVEESSSSEFKWYFRASSGAKTVDFKNSQHKIAKKIGPSGATYVSTGMKYQINDTWLPAQLSVFDTIHEPTDYVTFTIGGNDVDFADIISTCATKSTYLGSTALEEKINALWRDFPNTRAKLKQAYYDTRNAAGSQANIIVADYPQLLERSGKGRAISAAEAEMVDFNVNKFNLEIRKLVQECRDEGLNIHFVDVEEEFNKDGGHQAYSREAWINPIILGSKVQDINDIDYKSCYSMHPNEEGQKAYARCVNAKIKDLENRSANTGTLSGKICKASDRSTPITNAKVSVYKDGQRQAVNAPDSTGNYSISLPAGDYLLEIKADGYLDFRAYATVTANTNNYMETFMLVQGEPGETGIAKGVVSHALTGNGVEDVCLSLYDGWNNKGRSASIETAITETDGTYSITAPIGNYTLVAEKSGFITSSFNIIIQPGTTDNQNGTISPFISGDQYRIVLTWAVNPRDLDSHVEGKLSNGSAFHVFYNHKSEYDGDIEVCNLDVDDTTSYGPETVTLNITNENPYYYYIYHYAGNESIATSEAQIKVYKGDALIATFNAPTNQGTDRYWNVFAIVNGNVVPQNTISSSPELNYANVRNI